jgi:hypothetical protein
LKVVGGGESNPGLQQRIREDPGLKNQVAADPGFATEFAGQLETHKGQLDEAVFFKNGMAEFLNA